MEKCSICERFSLDPSEGRPACRVCLVLDRIRGVSLRLDTSREVEVLSVLHECEAKLRDLKSGKALEGPLHLDAPAGHRWSDVVSVSSKETPKPAASSSDRPPDVPSHSVSSAKPGIPVRKRHKKNKGKKRKEYQDLRYKVQQGRRKYTDRLDWSSSSTSNVD